jgi:hypothetical protein
MKNVDELRHTLRNRKEMELRKVVSKNYTKVK